MVEKLKDKIQLPIWMLTMILSFLVGLFTYSITFASGYSKLQNDVRVNKELLQDNNDKLKNLDNTKAEKVDVDRIYNKLDKIEGLLIDHMSKK